MNLGWWQHDSGLPLPAWLSGSVHYIMNGTAHAAWGGVVKSRPYFVWGGVCSILFEKKQMEVPNHKSMDIYLHIYLHTMIHSQPFDSHTTQTFPTILTTNSYDIHMLTTPVICREEEYWTDGHEVITPPTGRLTWSHIYHMPYVRSPFPSVCSTSQYWGILI